MSATAVSRRFWIPEVVQTSATDCGPAALAAMLEGLGRPVGYGWLRDQCATGADGTSIDALEDLAVQIGVDAQQILEPVDHVLRQDAKAFPAIAVVVLPSGDNHFVVLWRRLGNRVQVMDPALGRSWWTTEELVRHVYVHEASLPVDAVEAWLRGDGFCRVLRRRLHDLGGRGAAELLAPALEGPGWRSLAALDAACRYVAEDRSRRRANIARDIANAHDRALADPQALPERCWTVRGADDDQQACVRGAVLLRFAEGPSTHELLPAHAAAAQRPWRRIWALVSAHRPAWPPVVLGLLVLASGVALDTIVFRALAGVAPRLDGARHVAGALAAMLVLTALLLTAEVWTLGRVRAFGRMVEGSACDAFQRALVRLPRAYFLSRPASDLIDRVHQLHELRRLPDAVARIAISAAEVVVCGGVLIVVVPNAWWIVSAGVALTFAVVAALYRPLARRDLQARTHAGGLGRFFLDGLQGALPVRAHGAGDALRGAHEDVLWGWKRARFAATALAATGELTLTAISTATAAMTLTRVEDRLAAAPLAAVWALTFVASGLQLLARARHLPAQRSLLLRLLEPIDAEPEPPSIDGADLGEAVSIDIRGVSVRAGGRALLHDLDLAIAPGEHLAVVGPSGAGKSTLVGLLLGWTRPSEGTIEVNGRPLAAQLATLRGRTAWSDENVYLWNEGIIGNVVLDGATDLAAAAVRTSGLGDVVAARGDHLSTPIGEAGSRLSGGEAQRVRLARALARGRPALAILDEPFRGLDRSERRRLLAAVRTQLRDQTLLLVTHDLPDTLSMPRVVVVDDGTVVEDGPPGELALRAGGRYAAMLLAAAVSPGWRHGRSWSIEHGRLVEDHREATR